MGLRKPCFQTLYYTTSATLKYKLLLITVVYYIITRLKLNMHSFLNDFGSFKQGRGCLHFWHPACLYKLSYSTRQGKASALLSFCSPSFYTVSTNCKLQGREYTGKIDIYCQGFLVGVLVMKDTLAFGSDSSWKI